MKDWIVTRQKILDRQPSNEHVHIKMLNWGGNYIVIWTTKYTYQWDLTHNVSVFKLHFNYYFMTCYKQKSSLTYSNSKGFTCLTKEHGQTGWEGAEEDRNRSQGYTEHFSFHCLVVVLLLSLFFSAFFPFFSKQVFAHTVSICLSASKVFVITLKIIQYSLPQDEPSKEVSLILLSYGIRACHLHHTCEP